MSMAGTKDDDFLSGIDDRFERLMEAGDGSAVLRSRQESQAADSDVDEIVDALMALTAAERQQALKFIHSLRERGK